MACGKSPLDNEVKAKCRIAIRSESAWVRERSKQVGPAGLITLWCCNQIAASGACGGLWCQTGCIPPDLDCRTERVRDLEEASRGVRMGYSVEYKMLSAFIEPFGRSH
jgi:hypothetical protein